MRHSTVRPLALLALLIVAGACALASSQARADGGPSTSPSKTRWHGLRQAEAGGPRGDSFVGTNDRFRAYDVRGHKTGQIGWEPLSDLLDISNFYPPSFDPGYPYETDLNFAQHGCPGPSYCNYRATRSKANEEYAKYVDWPVTMIFVNNATIQRVKDGIENRGLNSDEGGPMFMSVADSPEATGGWYGQCVGASESHACDDSHGQLWDKDHGLKEVFCSTNGKATRSYTHHIRLYGDERGATPGTGNDRLYNPKWGFYVLGTTHVDLHECTSGPKFGWSEYAESYIGKLAYQEWQRVYAHIPGSNGAVRNSWRWLNNLEGDGWNYPGSTYHQIGNFLVERQGNWRDWEVGTTYPEAVKPRVQGDHVWLSDGWAREIWIGPRRPEQQQGHISSPSDDEGVGGSEEPEGPPPPDPAKDGDVNGDDKADLVTLHTNGNAYTYKDATGTGVASFSNTMEPAVFDADGFHVADVADVNADNRSDMITVHSAGVIFTFMGQADGSFGFYKEAGKITPGYVGPGGHEVIGVDDVTGEGYGDLVTFYPPQGNFYIYPGNYQGTFGSPTVVPGAGANSALFDREGIWFVDVDDVDGDSKADLVGMTSGGKAVVYPATGAGALSIAQAPSVEPVMADGTGSEPIGLGDVNGDGKSDLVTLNSSGQAAVYAGTNEKVAPNNEMRYLKAEPKTSLSSLNSSLLDATGDDFVTLLDFSGDNKADLLKVASNGDVYLAKGKADLSFEAFSKWFGGVTSNRFGTSPGQEMVQEKPYFRRYGCEADGCSGRPKPVESDVDGDRRADLVTLDASGTAHTYRAVGDESHATTSLGANSALFDDAGHHVIDVADVNGDGRSDKVTLHEGSVKVYAGKADGTFVTPVASFSGTMIPGPHSATGYEPVAVADVTGDAKADLVVFKDGAGIKVYPGKADSSGANPSFAGTAAISLTGIDSARFDQSGYHFLDAIDVTGDRRADLVASRTADDTIRVFKGNVNGAFVLDGVSPLALKLDESSGQELLGLGDVNGDARADLATLAHGNVHVYEGRKSGEFITEEGGGPWASGTSFAGSFDSNLFDQSGDEVVGLLDENGNRKADLVTVRSDGTVRIYYGRADFTFNTTPTVRTISGLSSIRFNKASGHEVVNEKPPALRAGCTRSDCPWPPSLFIRSEDDMDDDYRGELVVVSPDGDAHVRAGVRGGFRTEPAISLAGLLDPALPDGKGHYPIDTADVDDDKIVDLITVKDDGKVLVHLGNEDRTFATSLDTGITLAPVMNDGTGAHEPIAVADVTGDGFDDLVVFDSSSSGSLKLYKGQSDGKFSTSAVTSQSGNVNSALVDASGSYFLDVADVTGDGRADLVTLKTSGGIYVFPGEASGSFSAAVGAASMNPILDDGVGYEPIAVGDITGDGKADLLAIYENGASLMLWAGKADGKFASPESAYIWGVNSNLLDDGEESQEFIGLIDYSGDGRLDLVSNESGDLKLRRGKADATFEAPQTLEAGVFSVRNQKSIGHEFVLQRPYLRWSTCELDGCQLNSPSASRIPKFSFRTGSSGIGNGQFSQPRGVALDASGNIWVTDTGNHRIQKFNDKGEYLTKFGSSGTGNGQLFSPSSVAIDASGNIWVTDTGNHRIQKFNDKGEYLTKFGTKGSGNGQLSSPSSVAINASGNIWVADTGNNRIQKFNSSGEYLTKFGTKGSGNGQLSSPSSVAIDASGNIWVADTGNNRIQKFNSSGEYLTKFGFPGTEAGQLSSPTDVAIAPNGRVWVADRGNDRIQKFSATGKYLSGFGSLGTNDGQFQNLSEIAVSAGHFVAIDSLRHLQKWTFVSEAGMPAATTSSATGVASRSATLHGTCNAKGFDTKCYFEYGKNSVSGGGKTPYVPLGIGSQDKEIAISSFLNTSNATLHDDSTYYYRTVARGPGGVVRGKVMEFKTSPGTPIVTGQDATEINATGVKLNAGVDPNGYTTTYGFEYGITTSYGKAVPAFPKTNSAGMTVGMVSRSEAISGLKANTTYHFRAVATNSKGTSYGPDRGFTTRRVDAPYFAFSANSANSQELQFPQGMAADSQGNAWVADTENNRIVRLDADGYYLEEIGELNSPMGVAVNAEGHIFVAEAGNARVQEFDAGVGHMRYIGEGTLFDPTGVAVGNEGHVWVADAGDDKVKEYDEAGDLIREIGSGELSEGGLSDPQGIDVDAEGNVWVADRGNARIVKFDPEGNFLQQLGVEGPGDLLSASGLALDHIGNVWVVDYSAYRIKQFAPDGEFLQQVGEHGYAEGAIIPMEGPNLAVGPKGAIWLADGENHRVQKWAPDPPLVDADVNGDGRADLVTVRADGVAYVHPGGTDSKFGTGVASFSGFPLNPAQYDGTGNHLVDVADVDADGRSDLVAVSASGFANVYRGLADGILAWSVYTDLDLDPALLEAGGDEPIAVADVDSDAYGDLISYDDETDDVMVYLGNPNATFDQGVVARADISSALHTGSGHFFVDVADVTGDARADLVSMTSGDDLNVFPGRAGGTFGAPIVSQEDNLEPAMDDGSGYEPAGLGDVTGDRLADLVLLDNVSDDVLLYPGTPSGGFGSSVKALPGSVQSTTFTTELAGRKQFAGILDVDGDGHGDLTGLSGGYASVFNGQADGTFAEAALSLGGSFASTQHNQTGSTKHEVASEKPSWKRRGCEAGGC